MKKKYKVKDRNIGSIVWAERPLGRIVLAEATQDQLAYLYSIKHDAVEMQRLEEEEPVPSEGGGKTKKQPSGTDVQA